MFACSTLEALKSGSIYIQSVPDHSYGAQSTLDLQSRLLQMQVLNDLETLEHM